MFRSDASGLVERPRLLARLDEGAPVTLVCAPAGSGKTMLVAAWAARQPAVAWVAVERDETDAMHFWGLLMDALRRSGAIAPGDPLATLVPGEQDEFLQRLREGLERLAAPPVLVVDDVHELLSRDAVRGLERLLSRPPLRVVLISRGEPPLALHRLRLTGELSELRDLEFTVEEAGELLPLGGAELERLHARCEGWAAGLRLAALSLARHPDPARFVAEFSGSERTVADYLLGEVLSGRPPEVRRLLLRTCILERVCGPLADALTGARDGARLLGELEAANAFVSAVDVGRTWFRYHHLLADLLRLELAREAPGEVAGLHRAAAGWHAAHGDPVDAIRHARLGDDSALAVELLGRHWVHLVLDGQDATLAALLDGLPADDAELAAIAAAARLAEGRWREADTLLESAAGGLDAIPAPRRDRAETALATVELLRARRLGGIERVIDRATALLHDDGDPERAALALLNLAIAESWTLRVADAERHYERALELGRRAGRAYIELACLGGLGLVANLTHRLDRAEQLLRQSVAVAERVGWSTHPLAAATYVTLAAVLIERGSLAEGERWLGRAGAILAGAPEPPVNVGLRHAQGLLAFGRGRHADALAAFREGEREAERLRAPHFLALLERQWRLRAQVALGEPVSLDGADGSALWRNLEARAALAGGDATAAVAAVAPVLAGESFVYFPPFEIEALLLDGLARTALGEREAAERSVERALALAEPQGRVLMFLTLPGVRALLERHPLHRTAHAAHLKTLLDHLSGVEPAHAVPSSEPLSERELAVLRFLPTNLSAGEIGGELYLSVNTVKTHMRKLYAKLGVHTRAEAVQRGRALGLLAPGFTRIV